MFGWRELSFNWFIINTNLYSIVCISLRSSIPSRHFSPFWAFGSFLVHRCTFISKNGTILSTRDGFASVFIWDLLWEIGAYPTTQKVGDLSLKNGDWAPKSGRRSLKKWRLRKLCGLLLDFVYLTPFTKLPSIYAPNGELHLSNWFHFSKLSRVLSLVAECQHSKIIYRREEQ